MLKPSLKENIEQRIIFNKLTFNLLRMILLLFIAISFIYIIYVYTSNTPKTHKIKNEYDIEIERYKSLENEIKNKINRINQINEHISNAYNSIYAIENNALLPTDTEQTIDHYDYLRNNRNKNMIIDSWENIDKLAVNIVNGSFALDTIEIISNEHEKRINAIPSLWPLAKDDIRSIGRFGYRIHPIFKRRIFHKGADMSCNRNTTIHTSADGVVKKVQKGFAGGYGNNITIDHGYGYVTRYAHLNKTEVSVGDKVIRGQRIGLSGNTGRSTGPHLHFEVIYKGRHVNPLNYFRRNMTDSEFDKIMEIVKETTYED